MFSADVSAWLSRSGACDRSTPYVLRIKLTLAKTTALIFINVTGPRRSTKGGAGHVNGTEY